MTPEESGRHARRRHFYRLARQAARLDTSPEELRRLSDLAWENRSDVASTHRLIAILASHPNSPLDVLATWTYEALDAFLSNPILPLLALESPEFFDGWSDRLYLMLLSRASVPVSVAGLLALSLSPPVSEAARLHIALSGEAGADWEAELEDKLSHMPLPKMTEFRELAELGIAPEWVVARIDEIPEPSEERLPVIDPPEMTADDGIEVSMPRGGWRMLHRYPEAERVALASNPRLPPEGMMILVGDRSLAVHQALVRNPRTSSYALQCLAAASHRIHPYVIVHPNVTMQTLRYIAKGPCSSYLLSYPRLNRHLLRDMASAYDSAKRLAVMRHPTARDQNGNLDPCIARRVRSRLIVTTGMTKDSSIAYLIYSLPETPRKILRELASYHKWLHRLVAARHPKTPMKVRQRLAEQDGNRYVRAAARQALQNVQNGVS